MLVRGMIVFIFGGYNVNEDYVKISFLFQLRNMVLYYILKIERKMDNIPYCL